MQTETQIFPPKEVAIELKRVGFNEPCVGWYNSEHEPESIKPFIGSSYYSNTRLPNTDYYSAPTYDQVIGWFSEVHGIEFGLIAFNKPKYKVKIYSGKTWDIIETALHESRQQSLLTAFREAIKLIQK